jgi:hypothetical protein
VLVLQPRFAEDWVLRRTDEDLGGNQRIVERHGDWGFAAAPRLWVEYESARRIGLRLGWWQLDTAPDRLSENPPANGFGEITHPDLGDVDLSSVIPAETLAAAGGLEMRVLDFEVTRRFTAGDFDIGLAAGLKHAAIQRDDRLQLTNASNALAGLAHHAREIDGLGPSLRLFTEREAFACLQLSAGLRTSLLLAESQQRLRAAEDLDLPTPFTTDLVSDGEEVLPVVEILMGAAWHGKTARTRGWMVRGGVEAQWWSGVGTLADADADLALLGLSFGGGYRW